MMLGVYFISNVRLQMSHLTSNCSTSMQSQKWIKICYKREGGNSTPSNVTQHNAPHPWYFDHVPLFRRFFVKLTSPLTHPRRKHSTPISLSWIHHHQCPALISPEDFREELPTQPWADDTHCHTVQLLPTAQNRVLRLSATALFSATISDSPSAAQPLSRIEVGNSRHGGAVFQLSQLSRLVFGFSRERRGGRSSSIFLSSVDLTRA